MDHLINLIAIPIPLPFPNHVAVDGRVTVVAHTDRTADARKCGQFATGGAGTVDWMLVQTVEYPAKYIVKLLIYIIYLNKIWLEKIIEHISIAYFYF
jgi:hypothetical protein